VADNNCAKIDEIIEMQKYCISIRDKRKNTIIYFSSLDIKNNNNSILAEIQLNLNHIYRKIKALFVNQ
jgi:hypothetical protein